MPVVTPHPQDGNKKDKIKRQTEARAVIEARFMSMRLHAEVIGLKMGRIFATGGASQNKEIVQVMSDVFGVDVYTLPSPGGAGIGAACVLSSSAILYGVVMQDIVVTIVLYVG